VFEDELAGSSAVRRLCYLLHQEQKSSPAPPHMRTVLFVDDTLINRKVISRILKKAGFSNVTTVESGPEAMIELSKKKNYDLVISDFDMPGMSGTELSEAIATNNGDFQRPVVVGLTADTSPIVAERCRASGMSDVLYKPITVEDMKKYVETTVSFLKPGVWYNDEKTDR